MITSASSRSRNRVVESANYKVTGAICPPSNKVVARNPPHPSAFPVMLAKLRSSAGPVIRCNFSSCSTAAPDPHASNSNYAADDVRLSGPPVPTISLAERFLECMRSVIDPRSSFMMSNIMSRSSTYVGFMINTHVTGSNSPPATR